MTSMNRWGNRSKRSITASFVNGMGVPSRSSKPRMSLMTVSAYSSRWSLSFSSLGSECPASSRRRYGLVSCSSRLRKAMLLPPARAMTIWMGSPLLLMPYSSVTPPRSSSGSVSNMSKMLLMGQASFLGLSGGPRDQRQVVERLEQQGVAELRFSSIRLQRQHHCLIRLDRDLTAAQRHQREVEQRTALILHEDVIHRDVRVVGDRARTSHVHEVRGDGATNFERACRDP